MCSRTGINCFKATSLRVFEHFFIVNIFHFENLEKKNTAIEGVDLNRNYRNLIFVCQLNRVLFIKDQSLFGLYC